MINLRIWRNDGVVADVYLDGDDTLTIALDNPDGEDTDLVGITAEGQVTTWTASQLGLAAYGHCLRCGNAAGPDYHLAGAADEGENNVVCDDCWDERLR